MSFFRRTTVEDLASNSEARDKLAHYLQVLLGNSQPNYNIVKKIQLSEKFQGSQLQNVREAWDSHEKLHEQFMSLQDSLKSKPVEQEGRQTCLDLKVLLARSLLEECGLCDFQCGANRTNGEKGRCLVGIESRVSSWFLHHGEEGPLVPSGTIFFSGCNFQCVFCQNADISTDPRAGIIVSPRELARIATSLSSDGARNINYVGGDPIPNLHSILQSMIYQDHDTCQLWNSNMYNSARSIELLLDVIDIWLPDFKYGNDSCAKRLSGASEYTKTLHRNLSRVHDGMVVPGKASLIIRHLVMPNHVECCSLPILEWISEHVPTSMINLMNQYRPAHLVHGNGVKYKDIQRRTSRKEMEKVRKRADQLGLSWRLVS